MQFCPKCGTRMFLAENKYSCPQCEQVISLQTVMGKQITNHDSIDPVAVADTSMQTQHRVHRQCPQCENPEAFSWVSQTAGEHAGVKHERTLKRFKCTRCLHTWTESL